MPEVSQAQRNREWEGARSHANDLVRQYIDAYRRLYGEFPKYVTLPSDIYRSVFPTQWVEFMYLDRFEPPFPLDPEDPMDFKMPEVRRVRVRLIEVDA